ncbi:sugar-binding transcriptional regulator [Acidisoma cellulosilytica]|uniref:Sugar-binding transcriptional regulator n=1 Tax=Acidisoma cellulosilyticum TaxID=2802395 RepID=A0A964E5A7_9PROT|nr:sugar-binding transcriptional regulator [Acidisoma cellulosilyticum]MCB8882510.1 sugar-binding transcriptional regulator [Acidisoma cellulosilyticum]
MGRTKLAETKPDAPARMRRDALTPPVEFAGDAIVWAAWLYYEEGLTQEDISRTLGISRGSVVTMLQEARENGTVSIAVATEHLRSVTLARAIKARFGIRDCLVVPGDGGRSADHDRVGRAAAKLLSETLRPDDVLGVSWGRTVLALSQAMVPQVLPGVSVVQITGSAIGTYRFSAEACASNIANRIGGRCVYLHAPGIVSSAEMKRMLMNEPTLIEQFRIMSTCNKIIYGVGSVEASSTAFDTGFLSPEEGQPYRDRGAVAVLAGRFIDAEGRVVDGELDDRLIGMTIPDIALIPERICVAAGPDKAAPILALLAGGYVTVLVTDEATAQALLAMPEPPGG